MKTKFAAGERADDLKLRSEYSFIKDQNDIKYFLNTVPNIVLILNSERQIVFSNDVFLKFLEIDSVEQILGLRAGEVVNCTHSDEEPGGCGTAEACRECGAIQAVLESQFKGIKSAKECRIALKDGGAMDLLVWATPYNKDNESFTIASLSDISSEKRRRALERIFFHDILNTAGALNGFLEIIDDIPTVERDEYLTIMQGISENLIEEINAQKLLAAAENNEYCLDISYFNSVDFLNSIRGIFLHNPVAQSKEITIFECEDLIIRSDITLLRRVLVNLVKNALEASKPGEDVGLFCLTKNNFVEFHIKNSKVMSPKIKNQIFQRSFSTKGVDRGLGTYSIKLLTEKYLYGKVSFTSEENTGTIFIVSYPLNISN